MRRRVEFFMALTAALGLALPLHAQSVAIFANRIRSDLAVLSFEPTLAAWQRSRPGGKIGLAHYETEKDPFEVDFARMDRWCAVSTGSLPGPAVRAALFYVPSVVPGNLPRLPATEDRAIVRECRMQAIWYQASADISLDALINELSSFWGKPNGQTTRPDIEGSGRWRQGAAWHRKGMNIWIAYDVAGKPGGTATPRLIVYARRDTPPDRWDFDTGVLSYTIRNQVIQAAGRLATQDADLPAAVVTRSECLNEPVKHEPESLAVRRLAEWLKGSADAAPERRAAALLVADAYVACGQAPPQALARLGATFATRCPQDGPAYDGNFLRRAERLDPSGEAGELAGLASLGEPCLLNGRGAWPDLVIEKGEMLLRQFPPGQWTPWN